MRNAPSITTALALSLLATVPAAARGASPRHQVSIYKDDKDGSLRAPEGIACGDKGALVVADTGNGRLLVYRYADGKVTGGSAVRLAEAPYPERLAIDSAGTVLVLDGRSKRIVKVDAAGRFAGAVQWKNASGSAPVVPIAFKLDAADHLHVVDVAGGRVLVADPDGKVTREIRWPAGVRGASDLAVDGAGRIFLLDAVGSRLLVAEKGAKEFAPLGTPMKDRVSFPVHLSEDHGKLLLVDQHGGGIALVGTDGTFVGRLLEMGWVDGKVYYPAQACHAGDDVLFVADRGNHRVQGFVGAR